MQGVHRQHIGHHPEARFAIQRSAESAGCSTDVVVERRHNIGVNSAAKASFGRNFFGYARCPVVEERLLEPGLGHFQDYAPR